MKGFQVDSMRFTSSLKRFARNLFIQTETTPNVDSIKFKPGQPILDNGSTREFLSLQDARVSPLAASLMRIDGVKSVLYGPDFITITKDSDTPWQLLKPEIFGGIMDFFSTKQPIFSSIEQRPSDTQILPEDDEVVATIKELIETRIRPTIMEDGGDLEYMGFKDGIVSLKLKGSCRTCDSSAITLKHGIENMLMHYVPEVKQVLQVLDEIEEISQKEFDKLEKKIE